MGYNIDTEARRAIVLTERRSGAVYAARVQVHGVPVKAKELEMMSANTACTQTILRGLWNGEGYHPYSGIILGAESRARARVIVEPASSEDAEVIALPLRTVIFEPDHQSGQEPKSEFKYGRVFSEVRHSTLWLSESGDAYYAVLGSTKRPFNFESTYEQINHKQLKKIYDPRMSRITSFSSGGKQSKRVIWTKF